MSYPLLFALLAAATPEAGAVQPADSNAVTPYVASFFAASQPNSAMDMIARIPGFAFDGGDNVRGYGGAAGNVLIDGQRPATKSEGLEDALRRIQASQVERIDLIRGSAPGIDMQGKTVLANVVRKDRRRLPGLSAMANNYVDDDGRSAPQMRLEGTGGSTATAPGSWSALSSRSSMTAPATARASGCRPRRPADPLLRRVPRATASRCG